MATGHLNPGQGNIVTTLQRARMAEQFGYDSGAQNLKNLQHVPNDDDLQSIRRQARETWSKRDANETSYQDHFKDRFVEIGEFQRSRPTSGGRKNKPHPSMVFLTNRLHHCPGYHNADTTLAKDPYRIDDSLTPTEKAERDRLKAKFVARPSSVAVNQYKRDEELEQLLDDPYHRQGYEAAIKITNDRENIIGRLKELDSRQAQQSRGALQRSYRPRTVPSLHRYLRDAGAREGQYLNSLYNKHNYGLEYYGQPNPIDIVTQRFQDIDKTRNVTCGGYSRTKRGDFLMHPEWPPNFTAHRLNGLSSVDGQWAHRR